MAEHDPAKVFVRVQTLFPGGWLDGNGSFHFDPSEFHAAHGMPDTPESTIETVLIMRKEFERLFGPPEKWIIGNPSTPPPLC